MMRRHRILTASNRTWLLVPSVGTLSCAAPAPRVERQPPPRAAETADGGSEHRDCSEAPCVSLECRSTSELQSSVEYLDSVLERVTFGGEALAQREGILRILCSRGLPDACARMLRTVPLEHQDGRGPLIERGGDD